MSTAHLTTEDMVQIQQVLALYAHLADSDSHESWHEVFATDGILDATETGWGLLEGPEAVGKWFALGKPPHPPTHHMTNVHVYFRNGEVRARSKWFVVHAQSNTPVTGDYHDVLKKTPDGWRIALRRFVVLHPKKYEPSQRGPMRQ